MRPEPVDAGRGDSGREKRHPVGDEVTMDYAMHFVDPEWTMRNPCACGSPLCRRTITGKDWMLKDLRERYRDHFSPLINSRISKLAVD